MQLVIDVYDLARFKGKTLGVYKYAKLVILALLEQADTSDRFVIVCSEENCADLVPSGFDGQILIAGPGFKSKTDKIFWDLFGAARFLKKQHLEFDNYFNPRGFIPWGIKNLFDNCYTTIHDLIPFYYSNKLSGLARIENFYVCNRLKQSAEAATTAITISEASASEIQSRNWSTHLKTIRNALSRPVAMESGLPRDILFAITSSLAHKNAASLFLSYMKYANILGDQALPLVVCGISNIEFLDFEIPVEVRQKIRLVHNVSDDEILSLYRRSKLFIFLSLAEGFGLPPFEALLSHSPIMVSDIPVFRELLPNSVEFVNPTDIDAITNRLLQLTNCPPELKFDQICNDLLEQYSWKKHAQGLLDEIRQMRDCSE